MSEPIPPASLTERLAIGRLSNPGLVDRRTLQRAHERFAPGGREQLIERLQRRVTTATPAMESLPLARAERPAERDASAPVARRDAAPARIVRADGAAATPTSTGATTSLVARASARSAPAIARTAAIVARRVTESPSLSAAAPLATQLFERSKAFGSMAPAASAASSDTAASAVAAGTIQRLVERAPVAAAVGRAEPTKASTATVARRETAARVDTSGAAIAPAAAAPRTRTAMVFRKVDASERTAVVQASSISSRAARASSGAVDSSSSAVNSPPVTARDRSPATHGAARVVSTPRAASVATGSSPLVLRKAEVARGAPVAAALPAVSALPGAAIATPRLVLRKPLVPIAPPPTAPQPRSLAAAPPNVIARTHDAYAPGARHGDTHYGHEWDIDWITEQVGRRLARRLEIERERTGARSWRQAN